MFTISKEKEITPKFAMKYIQTHHNKMVPRLQKLKDYYDGKHDIYNRSKNPELSNNKVAINHASYIANMSSGYLAGNPVSYKSEQNIMALTDILKHADSSTQDSDLALDLAIFGRAFELIYMSNDDIPEPRLAKIDPRNAFVVYDDTVIHDPIFGVTYCPTFDDNGNVQSYLCCLYTAYDKTDFKLSSSLMLSDIIETQEHHFGMVPLNEIYNNPDCQGDFEQVISLIDAYNLLMSDRINDKEQFVNALLLLKGTTLGDDNDEKSETYQDIKKFGVLELPADGEAAYLTRQFDENSVEVLRNAIKKDIHTISNVPDMSDDNFGGNVSGVAMAYKLLGFELMTKTKERFFKEGLRYRLKCFNNILLIRGSSIDINNIEITMSRSLPVDNTSLANMISTLSGSVSQETLISQLPFVEDAKSEIEKLKSEKQDSLEYQQSIFNIRSDGDTNAGTEE